MQGTVILPCDCKDAFQDSVYGRGMRVHNKAGFKNKGVAYCTVCSPSQKRTIVFAKSQGQTLSKKGKAYRE